MTTIPRVPGPIEAWHAEYAAHLETCVSCRQDDDCAELAILESACDAAVARAYGNP